MTVTDPLQTFVKLGNGDHMSRNLVLSRWVASALFLVLLGQPLHAAEDRILRAMESFIAAFEDGDIEKMEAAFSGDAVTFPRAIMAQEHEQDIEVSKYRRVRGIDPQMRELIDSRKSSGRAPPYFDIEPVDLEIQVFGDAALATFHLVGDDTIGRRTFVLALIEDEWKIVHLHASNVTSTRR